MTACRCLFCTNKLEPAQELRFLVETDTLDDPAHLSRIRRLPAADDGRPLRVCKGCQSRLEGTPGLLRTTLDRLRWQHTRAGMLAAVGILSVGWVLSKLLGGPRV